MVVAGMRERGGKGKVAVVELNVVPGTTVYTDDAGAYGGLKCCYHHESVKHSISEYVRGDVHMSGIESVWSILKRSIHSTWHHVSPKHLGKYVNEATFRLNEGNCERDRLDDLFRRMVGKTITYKTLTSRV